jgi:hypothetical protein
MLLSRKSDTHNHLARKISKRHGSLHSVTSGEHKAAAPAGERPFAPIKLDESAPAKPVKNSIFGL